MAAIGIDFGTTNTVVALADDAGEARLVSFDHEGEALVYDTIEEYLLDADDPALAVTADTVLVVRGAGPRGYPGFPEVGNMPIPVALLNAGVTDMVRISDGRMSGTGYGTCVLHVAPESAVGGPLALVRTGDRIHLDAHSRPAIRRGPRLVIEVESDLDRAPLTLPVSAPEVDPTLLGADLSPETT